MPASELAFFMIFCLLYEYSFGIFAIKTMIYRIGILLVLLVAILCGGGFIIAMSKDAERKVPRSDERIHIIGRSEKLPSLYIVEVDGQEYLVNYNGGIQPLNKKNDSN